MITAFEVKRLQARQIAGYGSSRASSVSAFYRQSPNDLGFDAICKEAYMHQLLSLDQVSALYSVTPDDDLFQNTDTFILGLCFAGMRHF